MLFHLLLFEPKTNKKHNEVEYEVFCELGLSEAETS